MNRLLRTRLHYHRQLFNTLAALSATAVMLVATLMVAAPASTSNATATGQTAADSRFIQAPAPRPTFDVSATEALVGDIEIRATQLAAGLDESRSAGEAIAHVAAFTAEIATVAALTAALEELRQAEDAAEIAKPATTQSTPKHKRTRQSLAMPYFSFASRS